LNTTVNVYYTIYDDTVHVSMYMYVGCYCWDMNAYMFSYISIDKTTLRDNMDKLALNKYTYLL
jgi:hypothetical protein